MFIKAQDGYLYNLDHVQRIIIIEIKTDSFDVKGYLPNDISVTLATTSTREDAQQILDQFPNIPINTEHCITTTKRGVTIDESAAKLLNDL